MNQEQEANGPGIVVLSTTLQVLHMNRRAMGLLGHLEQASQRQGTKPLLSAPLLQHCQDIVQTLQARLASNNWERFHHYRVIGEPDHTILLKGFGLPDRRGLSHSRILMLLSPHTAASMPEISRMKFPAGASEHDRSVADSPPVTAK